MHKILPVILLLLINITSFSQVNPEFNKAESLVTEGLGYVKSNNWASYAKLLDPADLKMLKDTFDTLVKEDSTGEMVKEFEGIESKEKFLSLSGAEFFPYFMKFLVLVQDGLAETLSSVEAKILGSVKEDNMIHVITRQTSSYGDQKYEQLEIITIIERGGSLYIRMKDDIRTLAEQLRGE